MTIRMCQQPADHSTKGVHDMFDVLMTPEHRADMTEITAQAHHLREDYPQLYDYLTRRDRSIDLALSETVDHLPVGVGDLCEAAIPGLATDDWQSEEALIEG